MTGNKLRSVADGSGQASGVADQAAADNYTYDETGNLTADAQDRIQIEWTVYGKVKTVTKTDGSRTISYLYDASGNRTVKTVRTVNPQTNVATVLSTYYVRDAQGNVLSVYDDNNANRALRQSELYLYGSSRLGIFRPAGSRSVVANGTYTRRLGQKEYELTDHLGNVRAVVGDNREQEVDAQGNVRLRAALKSYANYYAFGLEMPGMNWRGGGYRYGYNGKEQDRDFQNNYDYGFRIYNPGVGRFLSVDPLTKVYSGLTPYQFAANTPIESLDLDGLERYSFKMHWAMSGGNPGQTVVSYAWDWFTSDILAVQEGVEIYMDNEARHTTNDYDPGYSDNVPQQVQTLRHDVIKIKAQTKMAEGMNGMADKTLGAAGLAIGGLESMLEQAMVKGLTKQVVSDKVILDFFGGPASKYKGRISIDPQAVKSFAGTIQEFKQVAGKIKFRKIIADNPRDYADYLDDAGNLLDKGGVITARSSMNNKYFNQIIKGNAKGLENFDIIKSATKISDEAKSAFKHSDGVTPVKSDIFEMTLKRK